MVIEEGIVIEKGNRKGVLFGNVLEVLFSEGAGGPVTVPEKGYYWAKVQVPSLDKPLLIQSKYNFSKGTKIRVKFSKYNPSDAELVVDWE